MSYQARGTDFYWDRDQCITMTDGDYFLTGSSSVELGEPLQYADGTGTKDLGFKSIALKSYEDDPGSGQALGVSIYEVPAIDDYSAEDRAQGAFEFKRDMDFVIRGPVTIINKGDTMIRQGDVVVPCDGGCQRKSSADEYSLGKCLSSLVPPGGHALIFVKPKYPYEDAYFPDTST